MANLLASLLLNENYYFSCFFTIFFKFILAGLQVTRLELILVFMPQLPGQCPSAYLEYHK